MKRFASAALAAGLAISALPAQAGCGGANVTHDVRIQYNGFFPTTIYVCNGDDIRFTNRSGYWANFYLSDGPDEGDNFDRWSGWISNGNTWTLTNVNNSIGDQFRNLDLYGRSNSTYRGYIEFGDAPTSYSETFTPS